MTVVLGLAPRAAHAQGTEPPTVRETVVVTASTTPEPFESVSRSVSVITREDLDRLGVASVIEALRLLPGVDVHARGPFEVQSDLSIRGATFAQSLVLADGVRLNDSQSAHHNGEIPVGVSGIDRIEVLAGAGSAVHGADALGGAVNVISRTDPHAEAALTLGQHGYAGAETSVGGHGLPDGWLLNAWGRRSDGFMPDRDFASGGAMGRGPVRRAVVMDLRHQRRAFGANGFYGASPSYEWTDQTLAAGRWTGEAGTWTTVVQGQYRNHGDHFRWDIARPGFAENRHRTDAVEAGVQMRRAFAGTGRLSIGASGGADLVDSSNLGDHKYGRGGAFAEAVFPLTDRATVQAGVRVDDYSGFGSAWSPSVSVAFWAGPSVRVRGAAAHAFRIPTYTELYYRDPAHLARPDLRPERGWSFDAGVDWVRDRWLVSVSPYHRRDEDVIDWVKARPADLWRTTNVRDVSTTGLDVSVTRRWRDALVRGFISAQSVDAPDLTLLSKYVLEYTRRSVGLSAAAPLGAGLRAALTIDHRDRYDGQAYALVHLRLSRAVGRVDLFADATNLLDERYTEVAGVAMPGRWITGGLRVDWR